MAAFMPICPDFISRERTSKNWSGWVLLTRTQSGVIFMSIVEHDLSKKELSLILRFIYDCRNADGQNHLRPLMEQLQNIVTIKQIAVGICRIDGPDNTQIQGITSSGYGKQAGTFHHLEERSSGDNIQVLSDVKEHSKEPCVPQRNARVEWINGLLRSCQQQETKSVISCIYIRNNSLDLSIKEKTVLEYVLPHFLEAVHRIYMRESNGVLSNLTLREKEVLKRMIEGKSNWEIAETLGISERTVKFHLGNIYSKLGVNTRVKAATLTMELS
ncbi:MAG: helix-turn-helix transcriptional regulator [Leptospirales bacterium]